jgi:anaerobic selenocysteine-containing dehydrogenase
MMNTAKSICRICSGFCGFEFKIEDGKIVSAFPDQAHPVSRGHACIKAQKGIEFAQGKNGRIIESHARQPDGSLKPINTQKAIDQIAAKLTAMIDEHGPRSVALFFGTGVFSNTLGNIFSKAWLTATKSPNLFTSSTIDQSAKWITAGRMGVPLAGKRHPEDIDVALISGNNPIISHYGFPSTPAYGMDPGRLLREMKARGTKLIVVDPRQTETARIADLHLQLLPGEDAVLYAGIIHQLFDGDWIDANYCDRMAGNVERLKEMTSDFDLDHVSRRSGVPKDHIRQAAQWLGTAKAGQAGSGTGGCMGPDSNLADFLIESVNVLIGGFRRAGDFVHNTRPLSGNPAIDMVFPPARSWEEGDKCRTANAGKILGEFPTALLPAEILEPGPGKIRALIVIGGNPALSISDPQITVRALEDLELLVVLDPCINETGQLADYIIPTAVSFERPELTAMQELFVADSRVTYNPPIQTAPPEVVQDWEFFWGLAARMGLDMEFKFVTWGGDYKTLPQGLPIKSNEKPDPEELFAWLCERQNISWADVRDSEYGLAIGGDHRVLDGGGSTARLDLCPDDVVQELTALRARQDTDAFRYRVAVRRLLGNMNSAYRKSKQKTDRNFAHLNPFDMAAEGIVENDAIRIASATDAITAIAKEDRTMRRGAISIGHLWGDPQAADGADPEGATHSGRLISISPERCEKINYMPHQTGFPVNIELCS